MENYAKQLEKQMLELELLLDKVERRSKTYKETGNRHLRVSNRKEGFQYYVDNGDSKFVYLRSKDRKLAKRIAQRDYEEDVQKVIRNQQYHINRFLKMYDATAIEKVYDRLGKARKELVIPLIETDEEYIKEWKKIHMGEQNPYPDDGQFITDQGEYVRSKSEKILADLFYRNNIPYCYEPRLELTGGKSVYPDFVLLNLRKRKTLYWEHLGLISDMEYALKNMQKLYAYEKSGFEVGKDIIISMESSTMPLDMKVVERKVREYLL
ncbi:MAG: hypothetical protein E7302_10575 [Butyrivibrio sp.]|nr:hypothetical protein [Butyrivibrio sp.]